jgi:adenylate kinase family enzyme
MRIAVVGSSGSGKTTLSRRLAAEFDLPRIELDAVNWQAGWVDLNSVDPDEFVRRVEARIAGERWVCDGNYGKVRLKVWRRATHLIWLDYDRSVIMPRLFRRSLRRALDRRELWEGTGNRETFAKWLQKDHPLRWAWDTWARRRGQYEALLAEPEFASLNQQRIVHPRHLEPAIAALRGSAGA